VRPSLLTKATDTTPGVSEASVSSSNGTYANASARPSPAIAPM
jgi:hypothetical protein